MLEGEQAGERSVVGIVAAAGAGAGTGFVDAAEVAGHAAAARTSRCGWWRSSFDELAAVEAVEAEEKQAED